MLVRFHSVATESVTMFGEAAIELVRMMGASGAVPGAITAEDIPSALSQLKRKLETLQREAATAEHTDDADDDDHEPQIALAMRAGPLLDVLERASRAKAPVMWEKLGAG